MHRFFYSGFSGTPFGFGMIGMWLPLLLIIGLLWFLRAGFTRRDDEKKGKPCDALDILADRFAHGELSVEEFETRVKTLEAHRSN